MAYVVTALCKRGMLHTACIAVICLVLSCPVLSCVVLSCGAIFVLPYIVLYYTTFSYYKIATTTNIWMDFFFRASPALATRLGCSDQSAPCSAQQTGLASGRPAG